MKFLTYYMPHTETRLSPVFNVGHAQEHAQARHSWTNPHAA